MSEQFVETLQMHTDVKMKIIHKMVHFDYVTLFSLFAISFAFISLLSTKFAFHWFVSFTALYSVYKKT